MNLSTMKWSKPRNEAQRRAHDLKNHFGKVRSVFNLHSIASNWSLGKFSDHGPHPNQ